MSAKVIHMVEWDVVGDGSSLWGNSAGHHHVNNVTIERYEPCPEIPEYGNSGELQAFGNSLNWRCYTDREIEAQMKDLVIRHFPEIDHLSWSEQGMQPLNGWSFDIHFRP